MDPLESQNQVKQKPIRIISRDELSQHATEESCWIIIHGMVYDITNFLNEHPGGPDILIEFAGQDATQDFEENGHSKSSREKALEFEIGVLEGYENKAIGANKKPRFTTEKKTDSKPVTHPMTDTRSKSAEGNTKQVMGPLKRTIILFGTFILGTLTSMIYYYYRSRSS